MYRLLNVPSVDGTTIIGQTIVRQDGAQIPTDPANTDYQAYLKWLEEGNQPLPPDE